MIHILYIFPLSVLILTLLASCDYVDSKLQVANVTNDTLVVVVDLGPVEYLQENLLAFAPQVLPFDTSGVGLVNRRWEWEMERRRTVVMYFYRYDAVRQHGRFYHTRIELVDSLLVSVDALDSLSWIVTYRAMEQSIIW